MRNQFGAGVSAAIAKGPVWPLDTLVDESL